MNLTKKPSPVEAVFLFGPEPPIMRRRGAASGDTGTSAGNRWRRGTVAAGSGGEGRCLRFSGFCAWGRA